MIPSQQKLAEKLTILNDRGQGMLTRIYNIKKVTIHLMVVFDTSTSWLMTVFSILFSTLDGFICINM